MPITLTSEETNSIANNKWVYIDDEFINHIKQKVKEVHGLKLRKKNNYFGMRLVGSGVEQRVLGDFTCEEDKRDVRVFCRRSDFERGRNIDFTVEHDTPIGPECTFNLCPNSIRFIHRVPDLIKTATRICNAEGIRVDNDQLAELGKKIRLVDGNDEDANEGVAQNLAANLAALNI